MVPRVTVIERDELDRGQQSVHMDIPVLVPINSDGYVFYGDPKVRWLARDKTLASPADDQVFIDDLDHPTLASQAVRMSRRAVAVGGLWWRLRDRVGLKGPLLKQNLRGSRSDSLPGLSQPFAGCAQHYPFLVSTQSCAWDSWSPMLSLDTSPLAPTRTAL